MSQFRSADIQTGLPGCFGFGAGSLFEYNVGDSCGIPFTITDNASPPNAIDLTGWTLTSSCRASINPPSSILFTKTTGAGINLTSPTQGQGAIYPLESDTRLLMPYHDYWIDVVGRDTAGRVQTLAIGKFRALPRVTAFPA